MQLFYIVRVELLLNCANQLRIYSQQFGSHWKVCKTVVSPTIMHTEPIHIQKSWGNNIKVIYGHVTRRDEEYVGEKSDEDGCGREKKETKTKADSDERYTCGLLGGGGGRRGKTGLCGGNCIDSMHAHYIEEEEWSAVDRTYNVIVRNYFLAQKEFPIYERRNSFLREFLCRTCPLILRSPVVIL